MAAVKLFPETQRLPCHTFSFSRTTPHKVVGVLFHLVQIAGNQTATYCYQCDCIWLTTFSGLLNSSARGVSLQTSYNIYRSSAVFPHPDLNRKTQIN